MARHANPKELPQSEGTNAIVPANWGDGDAALALDGAGLWTHSARRVLVRLLGICVAAIFLILVGWCLRSYTLPSPDSRPGVLPGEFERHGALLVAFDDDLSSAQQEQLRQIIVLSQSYANVWVLVSSEAIREHVEQLLWEVHPSPVNVRYFQMPFTCPWIRDFGPRMIKSYAQGWVALDFSYTGGEPEDRTPRQADERVPTTLCGQIGMTVKRVALALDGGNLLSNGAGLCLTTTRLLSDNPHLSQADIAPMLREQAGVEQLLILEPLHGEPTRHVDMFCTFTAPDTVVLGAYDPAYDSVNAAILDRNARRLAGLRTPCGPLKVERIPMPRRSPEGLWFTYTNVVYVDGLLIVPTYPNAAPDLEKQALATYRRLLPNWVVAVVNSEPLLRKQGSLHCATLNIFNSPPAGN